MSDDAIPVSLTAIRCAVCRQAARIFVCFCGDDVCVPCARAHQATCAYARDHRLREAPHKQGRRR